MLVLAVVLWWRILLLIFTVQPIPSSDAFGYDGAGINFLHGGTYCNPSLARLFPISGREVYAGYPPVYQAALLLWMKLFGAGMISAMLLHLALFALSGYFTLALIQRYFPAGAGYALVALLLFGFTFVDRPDSLAYVFGLGSLWLVARQISFPPASGGGDGPPPLAASVSSRGRAVPTPAPNNVQPRLGTIQRLGEAIGLSLVLFLGLYTSVIIGAYFFGAGFLACAAACIWRRNLYWFAPFIGAAGLFAMITMAIVSWEPLWWAGFLESARQQSVQSKGLHLPHGADLLKLIRTVPVFVLGVACLPLLVVQRKEIFSQPSVWLALVIGIFAMGWVLLTGAVTLLAADYVSFAAFSQILLAAGLVALVRQYRPQREGWLRLALVGCVLLVSVRALGITTWGAACAWKNSYQSTQTVLGAELAPFANTNQPVVLSSAFLYRAADLGVKNPINCDWYFDHAHWTNNAQLAGLIQCQPSKLVLTQFDYYRSFEPVLEQLRQRPELVEVQIQNLAALRPPDAIPALQRVVQHISWAPVIVDLHWKPPPR
jgi:hypothetical protein